MLFFIITPIRGVVMNNNIDTLLKENQKQLYVDPQYLRELIRKYKQKLKEEPESTMDDELASVLMKIAVRFSSAPSFSGYSYRSDFVMSAVGKMIKAVERIDPDDSRSPFSYLTQTCYRAIIQYIKKEKSHERNKEMVKEHIYLKLASELGLKQIENPNLKDDSVESNHQELDTE